jgi:hypothetical protein
MVTKKSEKSRFSTTSLRKIIFDVFLVYELKLRDTKIHKNVECCESKFSLFVEISFFDQKRMKIRFFQNFGLCIVSDVNIVTEK